MRLPLAGPRLRRTFTLLTTVAVFSATGCSDGDSGAPEIIDQRPIPSSAPNVAGLAVAPAQVWGRGRAVSALASGADTSLVVTTTGVYRVAGSGAEPVGIDHFDAAIEPGPTALSADATTLAVSNLAPPRVLLYDLTSGTKVGSYDLPPEAQVRSLEFDRTGGQLLIDTTSGPFLVSDRSSPPQRLVDATAAGLSALLSGGTVVTPIVGTADIVVNGPAGRDTRTLDLPEGASVLDARSGPAGALVAVSVAVGSDGFEQTVQIRLLDPSTLEQRGLIDTGDQLQPWGWTIGDDAVITTDGVAVTAWTFDGAGTPAAASNVSAPATELLPFSGGVISVHADGTIVRWAAGSWTPTVMAAGGVRLQDAGISIDGSMLSTVDHFGLVAAWNLADGSTLASDDRFGIGESTSVAVSVDGTQVGVSSSTGRVTILDHTLADQWTFQVGEAPELVGALSFDPASGAIATGLAERERETAFDDTVTVWDQQQQAPRFHVGGEKEEVAGCSIFYSRIRYSNDASMMAVTSHDFSVLVIDVASGEVLHELPGTTTVLDIAFSPDDDLLIASYDNGSVNVWQTNDFSVAATYQGAQGGYLAMAVMPDSATMAVTDITGSIQLVDLMTGAPLQAFSDASYRTSTLVLSPDGALLAAPTEGAAIGLWSTSSGERVATLTGHTDEVTGLAFSPQGDWLASSSSDGTARTWTVDRIN